MILEWGRYANRVLAHARESFVELSWAELVCAELVKFAGLPPGHHSCFNYSYQATPLICCSLHHEMIWIFVLSLGWEQIPVNYDPWAMFMG